MQALRQVNATTRGKEEKVILEEGLFIKFSMATFHSKWVIQL